MPVEVGEPDATEHVAGRSERADELRATATDQERPLARCEPAGDRLPEGPARRDHVLARGDPRHGVAFVAADRDVEVAAVGRAERPDEAERPEGVRRELGSSGAADRIDRYPEGGEPVHHTGT